MTKTHFHVCTAHPSFEPVSRFKKARPVRARQFVDLLIKPPTARMRHGQIRHHPLLLPIHLPEFAAAPHQVEEWLLQRGFANLNQRPPRPASTSWGSISSGGRSAASDTLRYGGFA
ncbi:hypothetical protein AK812_SmicGene21303 [Symbiodinium microadriaticum]|uniref:Uncharacterized protein n=1 Tax=Symbiodinium microadriaticum TaxID=2951 RepID=A0A1Q9DMV4_SYMMI|nr:hypothetical protein AK812_SmicGene21303 [Symbiodinium microadriaticum]